MTDITIPREALVKAAKVLHDHAEIFVDVPWEDLSDGDQEAYIEEARAPHHHLWRLPHMSEYSRLKDAWHGACVRSAEWFCDFVDVRHWPKDRHCGRVWDRHYGKKRGGSRT